MAVVKKGDFIEMEYTGRIKDSGKVFDVTNEEVAKKEGLYTDHAVFGPRIVCLGESQLIQGLDKSLIGREIGKSYVLEINPEEAFGRKDPGLLKVIQTSILLKQNINPFPGLQINASGMLGAIRSVTAGRTTVDFNHPLAGRVLMYEVILKRKLEDMQEQVEGLIRNSLDVRKTEYNLKKEDKRFTIILKKEMKLPASMKEAFIKKANMLIPQAELAFN
ncbi:FKBP-type peptidyl-prolyl cis-trans isomerase [Candidatus Woesearchaeota archaeon]|nr:FKBP-type peptidyl-prolyl cis-trans isomerase [Candidatus Woesearchaeota archaeon]